MPGDSERTQPPTEGGGSRPAQPSDDTTGETMRRTAEHVHDQLEGPDELRVTAREHADEGRPAPTPDVEVIEPPIPERVRRPADGVRLAVAVVLLVLGLLVADLAAGTRGAVEQDLTSATSGLPRLLLTLLGWMSGIGVLLLPIGVGADLLVRRRPMQLIQALGAAVVGGVLVEDLELLRDLAIREALPLAQQDRAALLLRHPGQRVLDPDQLDGVRADGKWRAAFEEGVRWVAPIQASSRLVMEDTEIRGCLIPKGDTVMTIQASANRDEDVFDVEAQGQQLDLPGVGRL